VSQRIFEEEKSVENQSAENSRNAGIKNHKNKSTSFRDINHNPNGEYAKLNHHKSMSTTNAIKFMSNFQTVS
jgi:hypothetical protein